MICRLFEYEFDIGKKKEEDLVKIKDCPHCEDVCTRCEDLNIKKTKNKFDWTISRKLNFPEDYGDEEVAIKVIHPSLSSFWVVRKISDDSFSFRVEVIDSLKDSFDADTLAEVNLKIKNKLNYDGKELTFEDF